MLLLNAEKFLKCFFRKLRKAMKKKIVMYYSSFINLIFKYIFTLIKNVFITKS